jgi:hypothetical protein
MGTELIKGNFVRIAAVRPQLIGMALNSTFETSAELSRKTKFPSKTPVSKLMSTGLEVFMKAAEIKGIAVQDSS